MAKLHFKYGAMNSGKTDTLIKTAYNYTENGLRPIVVKPAIDTKGRAQIVARAGGTRDVDVLADETIDLRRQIMKLNQQIKVDAVLVDEAQFLTTAQIDQLYEIAKQENISVIAYGLRADFMTQLFPGSQRLFEIADNIEKLPTMCRCGAQAEFNCRQVDGTFVFSGEQVAIDGEGTVTYTSLCGNCRAKELQATK